MARAIIGTVLSKAGDKSIVVSVKHSRVHPIYGKRFTRTSKLMAHDEKSVASIGDRVEIGPCRPMSARKHYQLNRIIERGGIKFSDEDATADVAEVLTKPAAEETAESGKLAPAEKKT